MMSRTKEVNTNIGDDASKWINMNVGVEVSDDTLEKKKKKKRMMMMMMKTKDPNEEEVKI